MYSFRYKGWFIQGNFMGPTEKIEILSPDSQVSRRVKSIRAAKCMITRLKREQ